MTDIIKSIYALAYNNPAAKKHMIEVNIKSLLYSYYTYWMKGIKSNYLIPWNIFKYIWAYSEPSAP